MASSKNQGLVVKPDYYAGIRAVSMRHEPLYLCGMRPVNYRLDDVSGAIRTAAVFYTWDECVSRVTEDFAVLLPTVAKGLLDVFAGLAASALAGGIIGAAATSETGPGLVAGALAGAGFGLMVATRILNVLGLLCLCEYVKTRVDEADSHFTIALDRSWNSCGDAGAIDVAAREFAKGFAIILASVFEGAVAMLLAKGINAGVKELLKSPMGAQLAGPCTVHAMLQRLGVTYSPRTAASLRTALHFFEHNVRPGSAGSRLTATESGRLSLLRCMDLTKGVTKVRLEAGTEIVAYRNPSSTMGSFYTKVGTAMNRLGIGGTVKVTTQSGTGSVAREFARYRVTRTVEVLESRASGTVLKDGAFPSDRFIKGRTYADGGGVQYFIPNASEVLEAVQPSSRPRPRLLESTLDSSN